MPLYQGVSLFYTAFVVHMSRRKRENWLQYYVLLQNVIKKPEPIGFRQLYYNLQVCEICD